MKKGVLSEASGPMTNCSQIPMRIWVLTLGFGALGVSLAGITVQHLLHLSPCPMCIAQRVLYLLIAVMALAGAVHPALCRAALMGVLPWAALGSGIALYQSWMQWFPELARECSYTDPNLLERWVDWLGSQWPSLFLATGFCSSREWVFLGLSMANWSASLYLAIVVYCLVLLRARLPER